MREFLSIWYSFLADVTDWWKSVKVKGGGRGGVVS